MSTGFGYDFNVFVLSALCGGVGFGLEGIVGLFFGFQEIGDTKGRESALFAFLSSLLIFLSITFHSSQGIR
jgi:hypothetical protein